MHAKSLQSCPTLCDATDHSPPGSSVHGILQARTLEWAAIALLQEIFPTQGSNPRLLFLLHWQTGSLPLSRTWRLPKCPSTDERTKERRRGGPHIHSRMALSHTHTKTEIMPFSSNTDGPRDSHIKWSKSDRERLVSYAITCTWGPTEKDQYHVISLIYEVW